MKIILIIQIIFLLQIISFAQPTFCSAYCSYSFSGIAYIPNCLDTTSNTCTICDTNSTLFYFSTNTCLFNTTFYLNQIVDLNPPSLTNWQMDVKFSSAAAISIINTFYQVIEFTGVASLTNTYNLVNNHYAVKLRMFILIIQNPTYQFQIILDGNTTNSIQVDNSTRLFFTNNSYDSYIYTSPDYSHIKNTLSLTLNVNNFNANGAGSFGIKQLMIFSKICPTGCITCTSANLCQSCGNFTVQYYLSNNTCQTYCLKGFYLNILLPNQCLSCDFKCQSCSNISTNCTSCNFFYPNYAYLYNSSCISACPISSYINNINICYACHPGCLLCFSAANDSCTSCQNDTYSNPYYLWAAGKTCDLNCPIGQYINGPNTCAFCNPLCLICSQNSTNCLSCHVDGPNIGFYFQINKTCLNTCPNHYIVINNSCICPSILYYTALDSNCYLCSNLCKQCYGPSINQCTSCLSNFYLLYNTNSCGLNCPNGQYPSQVTNKCYLCDSACYICSQNSNNCTGCSNNTYLFNNKCQKNCPNGYQALKSPNICSKCPLKTYSINNICVTVCPPDFIENSIIDSCVKKTSNIAYYFSFTSIIKNKGTKLIHILNFPVALAYTSNINFFNIIQILAKTGNVTQNLVLQNMKINSEQTQMILYSTLPRNIEDFLKITLEINFLNYSLSSSDGINYGSYSASYQLNDPLFVSQMYNNYYTSNLDCIGFVLSILSMFYMFLCYWNKYSYYSCLEYVMLIQTLKTYSYIKYPIDFSTYSFLRGFGMSQFSLVPNVFNFIFPQKYMQIAPDSFKFQNIDMNFFRMAGSNLTVFIIFQLPLLYLYIYDKFKYKNVILWSEKLGIEMISINMYLSIFCSVMSLFYNMNSSSLILISSQFVSFLILWGICYHYYVKRDDIKCTFFYFGNLINCILLPLLNFNFTIMFLLINIVQIGLLIYYYNYYRSVDDNRTKGIIFLRVSAILIFIILFLSNNSNYTIGLITLILIINLIIKARDIYFGFSEIFDDPKQQKSEIRSKDKDSSEEFTQINNTLYSEADSKVYRFRSTSQLYPEVILEHDVQESPQRDKNKELKLKINDQLGIKSGKRIELDVKENEQIKKNKEEQQSVMGNGMHLTQQLYFIGDN